MATINLGSGKTSKQDNILNDVKYGTSVIGGQKDDYIAFATPIGSGNSVFPQSKSRISGGDGNDFVLSRGGNFAFNGDTGNDTFMSGLADSKNTTVDFIGGKGRDGIVFGPTGVNTGLFRDFKPRQGDLIGFLGISSPMDVKISFGSFQGIQTIIATFGDDSIHFDRRTVNKVDIALGVQNFLNSP
jgi:hypothetical protein